MKFLKYLALSLIMSIVFSANSFALPLKYVEGVNYFQTNKQLPVSTPKGQVEVIQMFSYACPHCFHLEPKLLKWEKTLPKNVKFIRVPATFNASWTALAKLYYAAVINGDIDTLNEKIFNAIHVQHQRIFTEEAILKWVGEQGLDAAKYKKLMDSFAVQSKIKQATQIMVQSGIEGVPSFIVNGHYRTDTSSAGGQDEVFKVVNMLVEQAQINANK